MRIGLISAYNTPPSLPPSKCVHVSSILVERYCQFNSTYGRLWSSDGVAVCCASVWDIDGLFNNRLLQIEHQLVVVQRSCCAVRVVYYTTIREMRGGVCLVYIWDRRNKGKEWDETSEQLGKRKEKKKEKDVAVQRDVEFIILEGQVSHRTGKRERH